MRVDPSNAELQLLVAIHNDFDLKHLFFHPIIPLGKDQDGRDRYTVPDFADMQQKQAIYLDGPHHLKLNRQLKDEDIDEKLREHGWSIMRILYNGRSLPRYKIPQILQQMKAFLEVEQPLMIEALT